MKSKRQNEYDLSLWLKFRALNRKIYSAESDCIPNGDEQASIAHDIIRPHFRITAIGRKKLWLDANKPTELCLMVMDE